MCVCVDGADDSGGHPGRHAAAPAVAVAAAAAARIVPNVVMEIESGEGVREAVAKGHGIGVTCEQALPCDPRLKMLRFNDAEMQINRYLACLHERRKELMVDAFFEISKTDDRALTAAL